MTCFFHFHVNYQHFENLDLIPDGILVMDILILELQMQLSYINFSIDKMHLDPLVYIYFLAPVKDKVYSVTSQVG